MIKRLSLVFIMSLAILPVVAQVEGTQYFMTSLPQVVGNNPAFVPQYKVSVGLPGISTFGVGYYNSGFKYNDLVTISNNEVQANLPKWVKAMGTKNYISTTTQNDILRVGFRVNKKLYMQTNVTAYSYTRLQLPKEISSLFVNGTAPLVGTTSRFAPQAEGLAYVEAAVGGAYEVDEKLTVGGRLKYLNGVANVTTVRSEVNLGVGSDYQITANADLNVKTSGLQNHGNDMKHFTSNTGFGIDLGATYKLTDKITLAASIIDFGKISWKNNPYGYTLDKAAANYTFSGIDLQQVVKGNNNYLQAQSDSIQNKFKPKESSIGSYSTWLPGKMYVSGKYELMSRLHVGALLFSEKFQGRTMAGASASVIKDFGKWVSTSLSYTVSNRSYNNIGMGLSFNLAPLQFYLVGDNLLRLPGSLIATGKMNSYVNSTQVFNLRFGMNIVWGRDKDKLPRNTDSYNSNGKGTKEKVTDGKADLLKVRKRKK